MNSTFTTAAAAKNDLECLLHFSGRHPEGARFHQRGEGSGVEHPESRGLLLLRYHQFAVLDSQAGDPGRQFELLALLGQLLLQR